MKYISGLFKLSNQFIFVHLAIYFNYNHLHTIEKQIFQSFLTLMFIPIFFLYIDLFNIYSLKKEHKINHF